MEKLISRNRKAYRIIQQNAENVDPHNHSLIPDEEHSAKNMLFQLAENDYPLLDQKTIKINEWFKTESKSIASREYYTPIRQNKGMRKTVHIRPFAQVKPSNCYYQSESNLQQSIIPHLKLQLRKLQSPQKRRQAQQKKRKLEYLQQKMKRKNDVLVQQLLQNKKPSLLRAKKTQSQRKPSNIVFFNHYAQKKTNPLQAPQRSPTQQIQMIKQARKNRTLKNLLF